MFPDSNPCRDETKQRQPFKFHLRYSIELVLVFLAQGAENGQLSADVLSGVEQSGFFWGNFVQCEPQEVLICMEYVLVSLMESFFRLASEFSPRRLEFHEGLGVPIGSGCFGRFGKSLGLRSLSHDWIVSGDDLGNSSP